MNDIVSCPTCDLPASVADSFPLDSTDGLIEHLRISCIGGHSFRLPADRITHLSLPAPSSGVVSDPWPTRCTP